MPKFGDFSSPNFIVFGLNTEIYRVNLHMQSKYGKMRARKNSTLFTEWNKIYVFSTTTGKYILEKNSNMDTFREVEQTTSNFSNLC